MSWSFESRGVSLRNNRFWQMKCSTYSSYRRLEFVFYFRGYRLLESCHMFWSRGRALSNDPCPTSQFRLVSTLERWTCGGWNGKAEITVVGFRHVHTSNLHTRAIFVVWAIFVALCNHRGAIFVVWAVSVALCNHRGSHICRESYICRMSHICRICIIAWVIVVCSVWEQSGKTRSHIQSFRILNINVGAIFVVFG